MLRRSVGLAVACTVCLLGPAPARAGGLYLSEFATADMGAAGSGILAGGAGDASSSVSNPAAMTRVNSHELQLGMAPGLSVVEFDTASDTPVAGGDGGDQGGLVPLLSTSYVHRLSDRFRLGLGLISISGAALDPDNSWAGRNQITNIQLFTLSAAPLVAFRVNDWLSIGAGPVITYATLDWKLRVPLPGPGNNESGLKFDGIDDVQVAAIVGILLEPRDDLRFGLVYQSKTDLKLDGNLDLPAGLGETDVKLELPLAQALRADVIWQFDEHLALSIGGAWEDWSDLNDTDIYLGSNEASVHLGFKDTWKLRGGVHVTLSERLMVQTGISYDSSALDTKDRTPALPIDEQWRFGVGGVYKWTEDRTLGFSFQYTSLGNARVNNAALKGQYDHNDIYFFQMSLKFKKLPWDGKLSF